MDDTASDDRVANLDGACGVLADEAQPQHLNEQRHDEEAGMSEHRDEVMERLRHRHRRDGEK